MSCYSHPSFQIEKRNCSSAVILDLGYLLVMCLAETCPAEIGGPAGTWDPVGILLHPHAEALRSAEILVVVCFPVVVSADPVCLPLHSAAGVYHQSVDS